MFNITKKITIKRDPKKYLSFPDIIKSPKTNNRLFLIYREGDSHHPVWSNLVLWVSNDNGETWEELCKFRSDLKQHDCVWNCPRLSYIGDYLYIICDQKSGTKERFAKFSTIFFISNDEGHEFTKKEIPFPGMVPDKIISFKNKLFCANHKIKSTKGDLIQLVSWSRDNGITWYDTNIMAQDKYFQFCEASIVNMGDHLVAYLRENSGHKRHIYTVTSKDGIHWTNPLQLPIFGQRVTALKDEDKNEMIVGAYRDTDAPDFSIMNPKLKVSVFEHNLINGDITLSKIDWEYLENQYHFGYTGMVRIASNKYAIAYYVKRTAINPYIKLAIINKVE